MKALIAVLAFATLIAIPVFTQSANAGPCTGVSAVSPASSAYTTNCW